MDVVGVLGAAIEIVKGNFIIRSGVVHNRHHLVKRECQFSSTSRSLDVIQLQLPLIICDRESSHIILSSQNQPIRKLGLTHSNSRFLLLRNISWSEIARIYRKSFLPPIRKRNALKNVPKDVRL